MENTKKTLPEEGQAPEDVYLPGDPIPVPEATETNSDSAWAMWQDSAEGPRPSFDETVPMTLEEMPLIRKPPTGPAKTNWQHPGEGPRPSFDETAPMTLEEMPPIRKG